MISFTVPFGKMRWSITSSFIGHSDINILKVFKPFIFLISLHKNPSWGIILVKLYWGREGVHIPKNWFTCDQRVKVTEYVNRLKRYSPPISFDKKIPSLGTPVHLPIFMYVYLACIYAKSVVIWTVL